MKKLNKFIRIASDGLTVVETIIIMAIISYIIAFCISMNFVFTIFGKYI